MRFVSLSGSNFGSLVYQFGWSERRFSFLAEPSNKAICDEQTNTSAGSQGLRRKNVFEPFLLRPTVTDVGTDVLCSQKVTERILVLILMLVLRSEIPSGMCAKLRTVAASNNRVHMPWSLDYCLFTSHIWVMFFAHIPFVVNHTFNATPIGRLQQHPLLFTMNRTDRTFFLWWMHPARPSHPGHSTILLRSESPLVTSTRKTTWWWLIWITAGWIWWWVARNSLMAQASLHLAAITARPSTWLIGFVWCVTTGCDLLLFVSLSTFYACFLIALTSHGGDWTYRARTWRTVIFQARQPVLSLAMCWHPRFSCWF